jgi:hypothetical protein
MKSYEKSRARVPLQDVVVHFDCLAGFVVAQPFRGFVRVRSLSLRRDAYLISQAQPSRDFDRSRCGAVRRRSSLRGPCMKILQLPCIQLGACMKAFLGCSWEVLVSLSCKISSSSSRPFGGDPVRFSQDPGPLEDLLARTCTRSCKGLWQHFTRIPTRCSHKVLHKIICTDLPGDFTRISTRSSQCKDLGQDSQARSCGDFVEILLRRSCNKILKMLCVGACMKVLLACS